MPILRIHVKVVGASQILKEIHVKVVGASQTLTKSHFKVVGASQTLMKSHFKVVGASQTLMVIHIKADASQSLLAVIQNSQVSQKIKLWFELQQRMGRSEFQEFHRLEPSDLMTLDWLENFLKI
jgi:hypothetical protein